MAIEKNLEGNVIINAIINLKVNDLDSVRIKRLERLLRLRRIVNVGL